MVLAQTSGRSLKGAVHLVGGLDVELLRVELEALGVVMLPAVWTQRRISWARESSEAT